MSMQSLQVEQLCMESNSDCSWHLPSFLTLNWIHLLQVSQFPYTLVPWIRSHTNLGGKFCILQLQLTVNSSRVLQHRVHTQMSLVLDIRSAFDQLLWSLCTSTLAWTSIPLIYSRALVCPLQRRLDVLVWHTWQFIRWGFCTKKCSVFTSISKKIGITSSGVDSKYHVNPVQPPGPLRPLKEQLHGMAEKPVLPSAPGTPTGSLAQSEASSKHPYL